jgi:hypothetical protein
VAKVREIWLAGWVRAMRRNQLCPDCREVRSDDGYGHFVMPRGFSGPFYSIVDRASKISPTCNVTICGTGLNALMMESSAAELDPNKMVPIYDQDDLAEPFRVRLKLEFATTETEVHQEDIGGGEIPPTMELLASITNKVVASARLPNRFAELYPTVRTYVAERCFGKTVDLEAESVRAHLARLELQEGIARYLARRIAELTIEKRVIEFEKADFKLSQTRAFSWRRNLPPLVAKRTVFNFVATYNDFERRFAELLDKASDVRRAITKSCGSMTS